ncbi:MAG: hypothetical protein ACKV2U_06445 [Bryobacteraceae bacterium]
MKFSCILLFASYILSAGPVFWDQPNVRANFGEPVLPFGQLAIIDLAELIQESPQNQLWYTGGLVGYFTTEWDAPVWTTPWVEPFDNNPRDEPERMFGSITIGDPAATGETVAKPPVDNPRGVDATPNAPVTGTSYPVPLVVAPVPEPNMFGALAVVLGAFAWSRLRQKRV